jgi:hypothetical protein
MNPRISPYFALPLVFLCGCPQVWPDFVTCEEQNACGTTEPGSTEPASTDGGTPTTSEGMSMGDSSSGSSSGPPDGESGAESTGATTDEPAELPLILTRAIDPNYTDVNAILDVLVTADHADGVRMELENGEVTELTPLGPGEFGGEILAATGLENGQKTAWFTPWRNVVTGETVGADYVIALPDPGDEVSWQPDLGVDGDIAAIGVLPDGRPVEFGTFHEMGEPRCYLRLRDKSGEPVEFTDVLPPAHCRAIDLKIDRDTGMMHVLLERKSGDGLVWWAGESAGGASRRRTSASARSATRRSPWRAARASSRSAARSRWRRPTSRTRSPCCSARTSSRRSDCSTTSRRRRSTGSRRPPVTVCSRTRATRSCWSAKPAASMTPTRTTNATAAW